jgi:hypothetical protein
MSVFIGSTTPSQRACLSKEFKKLYAKKTFIPRKQKIAIALNTCDVGIKGVKKGKLIATSPSLESMTKLINNYFYSTTFYLEPKNDKEYSVFNKKGLLPDLIVVKKGGRYRFEQL